MKPIIIKLAAVFAITILLMFLAVKSQYPGLKDADKKTTVDSSGKILESKYDTEQFDKFSIKIAGKAVKLGDSMEINFLQESYGKPVFVSDESVTFSSGDGDNKLRTEKYKGLEIRFILPNDDRKSYEIYSIKAESPEFIMDNGIKVGDDLEKLRKFYPASAGRQEGKETGKEGAGEGIHVLNNINNEGRQIYDYFDIGVGGGGTHVQFNIVDNKIESIYLYYFLD